MQWIIDHLAAFVISCTVILLLAVMSLRGQDASIASVQFNAARTAASTLTEVLEQDLMNIGAGKVLLQSTDLTMATAANPPYVEFVTRSDRSVAIPTTVRYTWQEQGTVTIRGNTVPTYRVTRRVNGADVQLTGNVVTEFDIQLMRYFLGSWTATSNVLQTSRIDVSMTLVSPFGQGDMIEEVRWERQIMPVNLRRENGWIRLQN